VFAGLILSLNYAKIFPHSRLFFGSIVSIYGSARKEYIVDLMTDPVDVMVPLGKLDLINPGFLSSMF
ncbi:hypothetical protein ACH5RR_000834, partial [Cinchona calisaya]